MKEKESINLKDLANVFGMKVIDFAKMVGYSKQGLYQMLKEKNGYCKVRMKSTMELLKLKSQEMYEEDIKKAAEKENCRLYAIECLKEYLGIDDEN